MPPAEAPVSSDTTVWSAPPVTTPRTRSQGTTLPALHPGPHLVVEDGEEVVVLPLAEGTTRIGRSFAAEVELEDPTISRKHAVVVREAGAVRILDSRSSNGTWVNGERVESRELADGDVVQLGRVKMRFVLR